MNIFKKIGIILSCSIIAFLGVFGVVASTSNRNTQVNNLPVVERHNLVGSDILLTESNYSDYDLSYVYNEDLEDTYMYSGTFNFSGYLVSIISEEEFILTNVTNETVQAVILAYDGITFASENGRYIVSDSEYIFDTMGINANTYVRFNNINVTNKMTISNSSTSVSNNEEFLVGLNTVCSIYEPPVDQFLPTITTIVSDCVSWFVSIFTGLSDTFVVTNSNGVITGLSAWGQVLFIGVAILLVSMALKWVISLVRGI